MAILRLYLLGQPRIERDGESVEVDTRKAIALLAYLAITHEPQSRDTLATLLWPEYPHTRAFANLRRTIWALTKALVEPYVEVGRDTIALPSNIAVYCDVDQFLALLASCRTHGHPENVVCPTCLVALGEAAHLYRDDFLHGFTLADSLEFDEWQLFQTENLRRQLTAALERLVYGHAEQGAFDTAILFARRWLALDPLNEVAQRELMRLYAWNNQWSAAIRQYQDCVRVLDKNIGDEPQPATTALYRQIKAQQRPSDDEPPLFRFTSEPANPSSEIVANADKAPVQHQHNLPAPANVLVGRNQELAEINRLLADPACRLLTLVGPGGIGKTRLAIEAAHAQIERCVDGVFLVACAGIQSPAALIAAIADAIGFSFYSGSDARQQLINYLRQRYLLLLIDNAEYLADSIDLVGELLAAAPNLRVLATSIERLNLQEEWTVEIHGLALPESNAEIAIEQSGAVQLFVQSARRSQASFVLRDADRAAIVRICQLVGGLPLGIELAASWLRVLSCQEIVREIEQNLDFLATSLRNVPERHRSIRAVFDHSWRLLSEREQGVFRRLSVFRGGFRRAAAEQVAGATLPLLMGLTDTSLLHRSGETRFDMLELVRQYAALKLEAAPEEDAAWRHCMFFAQLIEQQSALLRGERQREALAEITSELENIRAGWAWAVDHMLLREAQQFATGLYQFFEMESRFQEGEELFRQMTERLRLHGKPIEQQVAQIEARQAALSYRLGNHDQATHMLDDALAVSRQRNDQLETAFCLAYLGDIARIKGQFEQARTMLEESQQLVHSDRGLAARVYTNLGIVAGWSGEYREARRLFEQSLLIAQQYGDQWGKTRALINLGTIAIYLEEYPIAREHLAESLQLARALDDDYNVAISLNNLGAIAFELGDYQLACDFQEQSCQIAKDIGYRLGAAHSLYDLGRTVHMLGREQQSWEYFREALQMVVELQALPIAFEILLEMLALLRSREPLRARAFLATLIAHPASSNDINERATALIAEIDRDHDIRDASGFEAFLFDDLIEQLITDTSYRLFAKTT